MQDLRKQPYQLTNNHTSQQPYQNRRCRIFRSSSFASSSDPVTWFQSYDVVGRDKKWKSRQKTCRSKVMGRRTHEIALDFPHFRNVCLLRKRYFHAQNNRLINPRCLESRETLKKRRSETTSLRVAILIFVIKQAVPATFIDFLQALILQIHLEIAKMQ